MKKDQTRKIYSVSEANYFARKTLEEIGLWIEGEVSRCDKNPSYNFYYLTLKDDFALLPAVTDGKLLQNLPGDDLVGKKVLVYGFLTLYEPRGQYQLKVLKIESFAEGLYEKQLEELIKKLKYEGLFDQKFKKPIPKFPKKVCIVTSKGSDAYNDFIRHSVQKFPAIDLYVADCRMQGANAIKQLLDILPKVDKKAFDVVVLTRGGGSLEDLQAFNDESVARVIFAMKTPIVVAIGHEANESVSEFVADIRASTPTDAANVVTLGYQNILEKLLNLKEKLSMSSNFYFSTNFQRLDHSYFRILQIKNIFKDLPHRLNSINKSLSVHEKNKLSQLSKNLDNLMAISSKNYKNLLAQNSEKLLNLKKSLDLLTPQNTLRRGYAIVENEKGQILRSIDSIVVGSSIGVKLSDGSLKSQVKSKIKNAKN